jgi:hypothetical protein
MDDKLQRPALMFVAVVAAVMVVAVAACGGGSGGTSGQTAHGSSRTGVGPAAHEVCEPMVRDAVPGTVGLPLTGAPFPAVQGDTFSCTYAFDGGSLALSVRDLHTIRRAHAYLRDLRGREAVGDALSGLAEGGFTKADGSVVAMKDAMVLTVDVAALPPTSVDRSGVAVDLAATVLGCWTADK